MHFWRCLHQKCTKSAPVLFRVSGNLEKTVAGPGGRVLDFISAVPGWQEKEERARYFEKQTLDNYTTQRPSPRPRPLELVEDLFRGVALQLPQEMSALGICVGPRPQACSHLPTPVPLHSLLCKTCTRRPCQVTSSEKQLWPAPKPGCKRRCPGACCASNPDRA